jgi:hypothetical protein
VQGTFDMPIEIEVHKGLLPCPDGMKIVPYSACERCAKKPTFGTAEIPATSKGGNAEYEKILTVTCPCTIDASAKGNYDALCNNIYKNEYTERPQTDAEKKADVDEIERQHLKKLHPHTSNPDHPDN